jgi:toxin HigB-1
VRIRSFTHAGLKRLYLKDQTRGLPANVVDKLRKMLAFLEAMGDVTELHALPLWKVHQLGADRKGTWALHVTANGRLTFRIETNEIVEVDHEDDH